MDNIAGSVVEGEHFFGRESEIEAILDLLLHHDVLLLGPRRIGKTSISREIMRGLLKGDHRCIEFNVAACVDEKGFLERLESAVRSAATALGWQWWDSCKDQFGALASRIKSVKIPIPGAGTVGVDIGDAEEGDWVKIGNDVVALIARLKEPWLIYIDELPILLYNIIEADPTNGVRRVRRFLNWFRNDIRALPGGGGIRWLVSGSVGLDTLAQQHGMADTINTLQPMQLPPFTRALAQEMLKKLVERYPFAINETEINALLDAIGWLQPYYIQRAFQQLRALRTAQTESPMTTLIEQAVDALAQPGADNDFHHWEKRLFRQLPPAKAEYATTLLAMAAQTREGARPETMLTQLQEHLGEATTNDEARKIFIELRDILQRDGYWAPFGEGHARRYRFLLEPLRQWWQRRSTL